MVITLNVDTNARNQMLDITDLIRQVVPRLSVRAGAVMVYVPHTTAGCTIQENADPDVRHDLLAKLEKLAPKEESFYKHAEGNSDSHLKTSLVGNSVMVPFERGKLALGRWQGIYLCEFDGPRTRQVQVLALRSPSEND